MPFVANVQSDQQRGDVFDDTSIFQLAAIDGAYPRNFRRQIRRRLPRAIVVNRQVGLCLLCHSGPFPEERFQGNLAPSLAGAGSRWSEGQLRLRIADSGRIDPASIMPAYHRTEGLTRVAPAYRGKPVLTAGQIEDIVAFLATLRD